MSRRKVRFFFCLLLVMILGVQSNHRRTIIVAAAPFTYDQPPPPKTHSFIVENAPVIKNWETAAHVFYYAGRGYPTNIPDAYFDPAFDLEMIRLRDDIMASAARHNRQRVTGLNDDEFAVLMAAQLYFEYNSALANRGTLARAVTPVYQEAQDVANEIGVGNFSVWPANLRPSVAASILRGEMPYSNGANKPAVRVVPITVHGSALQPLMRQDPPWQPSLSAVSDEIAQPDLAIEYLAANFEIASYRAQFDWVPVSWMTFVAWHNQGVVSPAHIANNGQLANVLPAYERYIPAAMSLIYNPPQATPTLLERPIAR
ncbi:MAG: hypothetical protein KAX40_09880 [Herpetosiphon sp.]|nr:hypothetical protein [Herpetosiphon sp.]